MSIGETIKERRKSMGLSAEALADILGVSPATIYRYENGDIEKIPGERLGAIAIVLHTTPEHLLHWNHGTAEKFNGSHETSLQYQHELYRAKIKGTNLWVIGFYQFYHNDKNNVTTCYITDYTSGEVYEIEPETLGKAVGKLDVTGKQIFSGDIVKFYNNSSEPEDFITCVIEWEAEKFRWCIFAIEEKKRFFISPTGKYEVIGNVVDNPDLINVK